MKQARSARLPKAKGWTLAIWAAVLTAIAVPLSAHHSSSAYDLSKSIEWKVTVTQFQFVNPHSYVFFTMSDASGKTVSGRCELPAQTALRRVGWSETSVKPGGKGRIMGAPGRNEEHVCFMHSFTRENGETISRDEDLTRNGANPLATLASVNKTTPRADRLANGHPNLQGLWVGLGGEGRGPRGRGRGGPPGGPGAGGKKGPPGRGPRVEATPEGQAAAKNYDQPFDDPAIRCDPANILFGWVHDSHVNEIVQKDDEIKLTYGYMDLVRTVHLNLTEHPKQVAASRGGHSIGKWEGDTLVVDTTHLSAGVLIPIIGIMYSDQMHIVERFTFDASSKLLTRTYRAEDPLYLKTPYTGQDFMMLSDEPYMPYHCVELSGKNNLRPK